MQTMTDTNLMFIRLYSAKNEAIDYIVIIFFLFSCELSMYQNSM